MTDRGRLMAKHHVDEVFLHGTVGGIGIGSDYDTMVDALGEPDRRVWARGGDNRVEYGNLEFGCSRDVVRDVHVEVRHIGDRAMFVDVSDLVDATADTVCDHLEALGVSFAVDTQFDAGSNTVIGKDSVARVFFADNGVVDAIDVNRQ